MKCSLLSTVKTSRQCECRKRVGDGTHRLRAPREVSMLKTKGPIFRVSSSHANSPHALSAYRSKSLRQYSSDVTVLAHTCQCVQESDGTHSTANRTKLATSHDRLLLHRDRTHSCSMTGQCTAKAITNCHLTELGVGGSPAQLVFPLLAVLGLLATSSPPLLVGVPCNPYRPPESQQAVRGTEMLGQHDAASSFTDACSPIAQPH